jgi:hypothetical protein
MGLSEVDLLELIFRGGDGVESGLTRIRVRHSVVTLLKSVEWRVRIEKRSTYLSG